MEHEAAFGVVEKAEILLSAVLGAGGFQLASHVDGPPIELTWGLLGNPAFLMGDTSSNGWYVFWDAYIDLANWGSRWVDSMMLFVTVFP